jgi:hypothetical protein
MNRPFQQTQAADPASGPGRVERTASTLEHALAMGLLSYLEGGGAAGRTLAACISQFGRAGFSMDEVKAAVRELAGRRLLIIHVSTEHDWSPVLRLQPGVTPASYTEAQDQRVY